MEHLDAVTHYTVAEQSQIPVLFSTMSQAVVQRLVQWLSLLYFAISFLLLLYLSSVCLTRSDLPAM